MLVTSTWPPGDPLRWFMIMFQCLLAHLYRLSERNFFYMSWWRQKKELWGEWKLDSTRKTVGQLQINANVIPWPSFLACKSWWLYMVIKCLFCCPQMANKVSAALNCVKITSHSIYISRYRYLTIDAEIEGIIAPHRFTNTDKS